MSAYELEKTVWSQADFKAMGWHDATIWSMVSDPEHFEYLIDLDYIFKWVLPSGEESFLRFWVAPVTMVFESAFDISIDMESQQGLIEVADLFMENPELSSDGKLMAHRYRFKCQEGELSLKATGFKMYVRKAPVLMEMQRLELEERGGVSFFRKMENG